MGSVKGGGGKGLGCLRAAGGSRTHVVFLCFFIYFIYPGKVHSVELIFSKIQYIVIKQFDHNIS